MCQTCHDEAVPNPPAKDWKIDRITDRGPGHYYRFHVQGRNLGIKVTAPDHRFSWSVRDVDDPRYDLTDAVEVPPSASTPIPSR